MGLVLSTKNLILKELLLMTTHEGLKARTQRARLTYDQNKKRLQGLCRNKRIIRILRIQVDLGAKL